MRDHRLLSGGIRQLTAGALVDRGLGFVNALLLLRVLPLRDYGMLALIYSFYTLADFFVGLAQSDLIVARCSRARGRGEVNQANELFRSYLLLVAAGIIVVVMIGASGRWLLRGEVLSPGLYWVAVAGALATSVRNLIITELRVAQNFRALKHVDVIRSVALTVGYVLGIVWLRLGVAGAVAAYTIAAVAPLAVILRDWPRVAAIVRGAFSWRPIADLLQSEGRMQLARYGVVNLHVSVRPWLIQAALGIEAVALFNAAKSVLGLPMDLLPIKEVLIPIMSHERGRRGRLGDLYVDGARYATWLFGAMALGLVLLAPVVFTALFPQYQAAIPVIRIMAVGFLASGIATPQAALLYALQLQHVYLATTVLSFLLMLAWSVPLMRLWGVSGMAVGFVLNGFVTAFVRHAYLARRHADLRFPLSALLKWAPYDRQFMRALLWGR